MMGEISNLNLEILDPDSPDEVARYERAFYKAYERASGNMLIRKLWNWNDEEQRLAVKVPYNRQLNYILRCRDTGEIVTALAVNRDCIQAQSVAYGFQISNSTHGTCEFLTLFSLNEYDMHSRFAFWRLVFADLQARGYKTAFGTTAKRLLRFYLRMGAEVIDQRTIEEEERFFLKFDTSCTSWQIARGRRESRRDQ